MQAVSAGYDPYTPTRRVDVDIQWIVVDTAAAGNASVSASRREPISVVNQLKDEDTAPAAKWATLEDNLWSLDGTWDILPDSTSGLDIGYWSAISSSGSIWSSPYPTVTFTLSAPASSAGFEFLFDDKAMSWPTAMTIEVYSGTTLLSSKAFTPDGPRFVATMNVENYDKVVVTFNKTSKPRRRVRMYHMLFGIGEYLNKKTAASAKWNASLSPASETFPSAQLVFSFNNAEKKYNFFNPTGIYKYLQDGQQVRSAAIVNGEKVDMGTFYFRSAKAQDDALTAEITATDRVLALENEIYNNGTTGGWTVSEALTDVLGGSWTYDTTAEILSRTVRRCIPLGTNKREAVRMIAQAAMTSVWINRAGQLVLRDFSTTGSSVDTLTRDELRSMDGITVAEPVDCVVLTCKDEFQDPAQENEFVAGNGANVVTIDNPLVVPADGDTVAAWLLAMKQMRLNYKVQARGNPAVEPGDVVTIYNAYDEEDDAIVTGIEMDYSGGLAEQLEAIG